MPLFVQLLYFCLRGQAPQLRSYPTSTIVTVGLDIITSITRYIPRLHTALFIGSRFHFISKIVWYGKFKAHPCRCIFQLVVFNSQARGGVVV